MKAAYALLCLALAQGISASIFKRTQKADDVIIQPLDYINQYQLPYQTQQAYQDYIRSFKQQKKQKQYSASSSHESDEWNEPQYVTLRSTGSKWNTPLFTAVMKVQNEAVGETPYGNIMWEKNIQVPVKQKKQKQPTAAQQQEIQQIFAQAQQAMKHPTPEEKVLFHQAFSAAAQTHNEDDHLNATQLLQKYQYPVEEHTVKTDDGYVLTVFRIQPKKQIPDMIQKPAVFLMHGVLGSADDWLLMGPGKSLAYMLSDAGYDVWLGNARGNKYTRHVSKHPALDDYWQFSNDEIALHDLPAMIDYVLQTAAQQKMYYVGHSQGATVFFALAAARPEYNDKIAAMYALAPAVYMQHARSPLVRMMAPGSALEPSLHHELGHGKFQPSAEVIAAAGGQMLWNEIGCKNLSSHVAFVMAGANIDSLTPELAPVVMKHLPAGTSTKVIRHFGQQVSDAEFRRYSYGPAVNQRVYGAAEAPVYQLQRVTVPVTVFHAERDWLAAPADVARLQRALPAATLHQVPDPHFSHLDFQFSTKAPELVYKQLIESMKI